MSNSSISILEGRIIPKLGMDLCARGLHASRTRRAWEMLTALREGLRHDFPASRRLLFAASFLLVFFGLVPSAAAQQNLIKKIETHGSRRIPQDTIRARMFTKAGDVYDQQSLERDFNSLWNTGYFEDLRFEREGSETEGWVLHVYVTEKPTIREITYQGLNSVSQSDVLDRFKERKVSLTQESQYDATRVKRAEVVLKELLSERGRQFSTIRTEVKRIPPAAVGVTFIVKEGPKVKVGKIRFEGNKKLSSSFLRHSMRGLRPIGIPHSIFLESLFSKTYDASKLSQDTELVRRAYQTKGYFKAIVGDPMTQMRDTNTGLHLPLIRKRGKAVDLTLPVEEGDRYRLAKIEFTGNKAVTNTAFLRQVFPMKDGDLFNVEIVAKGLEQLRKVYGEIGYINFTPVPDTEIDEDKHEIKLTIDLDEGKQFSVRRIEFRGNTTTRDKVIRRELAVEEGNLYNSRLWELSLLRLNQLGYFDPLKPEQDSEVHQNPQESTVDISLKVKEKGKNSIGLSGGVSGLAGSFIGLSYETNNFLGLGETLSVQANVGSQQRNIQFGFTEPYLFDRPLQFGFTVFSRRFDFDQLQQSQVLAGQRLALSPEVQQSLQNFTQSSTGFTTSISYPLRRSFKRVGITYTLDKSSTEVFSEFSKAYFQELNFRNISGPDALKGVITSKLLPSFTSNTVDNPQRPHSGKSFYVGGEFAGAGGDVSFFRPIIEWKHFLPMKGIKPVAANEGRNTLAYRIQGSFLRGYGGRVAPPWERFFIGGENDVRGFDIRGISPLAFFVERVDFPLRNPDNSLVARNPSASVACSEANLTNCVTVPIPVHRLIFPGGDTNIVANVEYRIPIAGPITLALFADAGINAILSKSQLQLNEAQLTTLNTTQFGCPTLDTSFACSGGVAQPFGRDLRIISASNWKPRVSTGVELQVIMPIVNAPFRIYYALNPVRLDTFSDAPFSVTRDMFPVGGAGDYSYRQALTTYGSDYKLYEPKKTFRFTVSTTF